MYTASLMEVYNHLEMAFLAKFLKNILSGLALFHCGCPV